MATPEQQPSGEVVPASPAPPPLVPPQTPYTVQQLTQVNTGIPAHCWTPETLKSFHEALTKISLDNNRVVLDNNEKIDRQKGESTK